MSLPGYAIDPDPFYPFEDIIDGYFPLQVSLAQMMTRLDVAEAVIDLRHAPIMHIPGLPPTSPVPLRVERGNVGQIDHMALYVRRAGAALKLSGHGTWNWYAPGHQSDGFDPLTRLAEPAFVTGFALGRAPKGRDLISGQPVARRVFFDCAKTMAGARDALKPDQILGPFGDDEQILRGQGNGGGLRARAWAIFTDRNGSGRM